MSSAYDEFIVNWFTIPPLDKQSLVEARGTQEKRHNQERDRWQYEMDLLRRQLADAQAECKEMRAAVTAKNTACAEAAMLINRAEDALKRAHSA